MDFLLSSACQNLYLCVGNMRFCTYHAKAPALPAGGGGHTIFHLQPGLGICTNAYLIWTLTSLPKTANYDCRMAITRGGVPCLLLASGIGGDTEACKTPSLSLLNTLLRMKSIRL